MTFKQQLLKIFYKLRMMLSRTTGVGKTTTNNSTMTKPAQPFYGLQAVLNNGKSLAFETLKGKYVMLANTASNCGYTGQYDDLEKLHQQYKDKLIILGFPANNFGGQEPGTDSNIAEFCKINYGVTFPLIQKASVKGKDKQPVYDWLTDAAKNGWNSQEPSWNFCKYLVSPDGVLLRFFSSAVSPLDKEVTDLLQ